MLPSPFISMIFYSPIAQHACTVWLRSAIAALGFLVKAAPLIRGISGLPPRSLIASYDFWLS